MPVRKATIADIPRLKEIRGSVRENILSDPSQVTDEDYRWFTENGLIWVWDEGSVIRGFAAGDTRNGTIWALFVDPAHEKQGIGRALLPFACQSLKEAGYGTASLSTERGTRAESFYRADGWIEMAENGRGEVTFTKAL